MSRSVAADVKLTRPTLIGRFSLMASTLARLAMNLTFYEFWLVTHGSATLVNLASAPTLMNRNNNFRTHNTDVRTFMYNTHMDTILKNQSPDGVLRLILNRPKAR